MANQDHSNVVRLPTAQTRKVKQPGLSRKYFAAVAELPRHSAEYKNRVQRNAERSAEIVMGIGKSASLIIATAIFQTLDSKQKACVKMYCAMLADTEEGQQAIEWLNLITADYGTSTFVKSAMKRKAAERGL